MSIPFKILYILIVALGFGCSYFHKEPPPHEEEFVLRDGIESFPVGHYLLAKKVQKDSDPNLVIENEEGWEELRKPNVNFGFTTQDIWLKLNVRNLSSSEHFTIVIANNRLNFVDFYWTDSHGKHGFKSTGDHLPLEAGDQISFPYYAFQIHKGEVAKLWIKVNSDSHISFLPTVYSNQGFIQYANWREKEGLFLFLLILILILLYTFVLKEVSTSLRLVLCAYTLFAFLYSFFNDGEGTRLIFSHSGFFRNYAMLVFLSLGGLFFSQFLKEYFIFKLRLKWLRIIFNLISISFFIVLILTFTNIPNSILVQVRSGLFMIIYVFMIYGIVYHVMNGHKWILYYLLAKFLVTCFSIVEILMLGGFIDYSPIIAMGISVGIQIEAIGILLTLKLREKALSDEQEDIAQYL
jgi:hypothetical protein